MIVFNDLYQNEEGRWCVSYTEEGVNKVMCFDNNEDAVNFYMS